MFFQVAKDGKNDWYLYVISLVLCMVANLVASLPLFLFLFNQENGFLLSSNMAEMFAQIENKNLLLVLVALPFVATLLVFIFCIRNFHKRSVQSVATGFSSFRWNQFFFAFFVCSMIMVVSTLASYYALPDQFILQFQPQKFALLVIIALVFITIQSCTEEIIFRGYLTQGFGALTKSRIGALVLPTILFASLHLGNPEVVEHGIVKMFPLYFILGLSFAIMTLMNDGTELAMGYHSANNIMICLLVTSPEAVLQTHSIFRTSEVANIGQQYVSIIVIETIVLLIFAWKYKWTNWYEKLLGPIN